MDTMHTAVADRKCRRTQVMRQEGTKKEGSRELELTCQKQMARGG